MINKLKLAELKEAKTSPTTNESAFGNLLKAVEHFRNAVRYDFETEKKPAEEPYEIILENANHILRSIPKSNPGVLNESK